MLKYIYIVIFIPISLFASESSDKDTGDLCNYYKTRVVSYEEDEAMLDAFDLSPNHSLSDDYQRIKQELTKELMEYVETIDDIVPEIRKIDILKEGNESTYMVIRKRMGKIKNDN